MEEGRASDEAGPKIGVDESLTYQVGAFEGGRKARGSGAGDRREKSEVFEGEEGIGIVGQGFTHTLGGGRGEEQR